MGRNGGRLKQLKRVDGELQLAPIMLDLERPPTSGLHLKRCCNETRFKSNDVYDEVSSTYSADNGESCQEQSSYENVEYEELQNSTAVSAAQHLSEEELLNEQLSNETCYSLVAPISDYTEFSECTGKTCESGDMLNNNHIISSNEVFSTYPNTICSDVERTCRIQETPFVSNTTYVTATAVMSNGMTIREEAMSQTLSVGNATIISTETATAIQMSSNRRHFPGGTPSPIWSMQNQIATPYSESQVARDDVAESSSLPSSFGPLAKDAEEKEGDMKAATAITSTSKLGDGDTSSSRDSPPTPAISVDDKAPFTLKFKRRRPLPRSRITRTAGSARASLPTTASTPIPAIPSESEFNTILDAPAINNYSTSVADTNISITDRVDTDNSITDHLDANNNITNQVDVNNNVTEQVDINNNKAEEEKVKEKESKTLLELLEQPVVRFENDETIVQKSEQWTVSTKSESAKSKRKSGKKSGGNDQVVVDLENSEGSSGTGTGTGSTGNSYPSYISEESSSSSSSGPADATLITEKGAIKFHLPGRIMHKTTIKVAHFPTDTDKAIIVNAEPEDNGIEVECPPPLCQGPNNNQNYYCPPDPCFPYGYNPYGYPPNPYQYGCSPYSYPPYCYGYPPYYG